jgi:predicted Ser/Thr protein kinase
MTLEVCLPETLRGPATTITPLGGGLSGAGVYRVDAGGRGYVLKIARADAPIATWRQSVEIQRRAGEVGVAPRVVHADEARRAVVSEHVVNRGFAPRLANPQTRVSVVAAST